MSSLDPLGAAPDAKKQKLMQLESWNTIHRLPRFRLVCLSGEKKTSDFLEKSGDFKFEPFLFGIWRDLEFFQDTPICRNTHLQLLETRLHLHLCPGLNGIFSSQQVVWRNVPPKEIWVVVTSTNHQINRSSRQTTWSVMSWCFRNPASHRFRSIASSAIYDGIHRWFYGWVSLHHSQAFQTERMRP